MDVEGLVALLRSIERSETRVIARTCPRHRCSPRSILTARPYAYLDDAPLEEHGRWPSRRDAGSIRSPRPRWAARPAAIAAVREEAWPEAGSADELHDALMSLGVVTGEEGVRSGWSTLLEALVAARVARRGCTRWDTSSGSPPRCSRCWPRSARTVGSIQTSTHRPSTRPAPGHARGCCRVDAPAPAGSGAGDGRAGGCLTSALLPARSRRHSRRSRAKGSCCADSSRRRTPIGWGSGRRSARMVRASPPCAYPPVHHPHAACRDRARVVRRLHALPARLAGRDARPASGRNRIAGCGHYAARGVRDPGLGVGIRRCPHASTSTTRTG